MKNALFLPVCAVLAGLMGCSKSKSDSSGCTGGATTFQLDQPFSLCYGTTAQEQDDNTTLAVHFDEVVGDSRCASDVICVWQGRVDVALSYTLGQEGAKDTLFLGGLDGDPTADSTMFAGYKIKLLKVDPYPASAATPAPKEDYKIKLLVTH